MCGIFGVISKGSNCFWSTAEGSIDRRGPDGDGVADFKFGDFLVHLRHTRLAIMDLSEHGHQPMQDDFSQWCISYNGEIYNFIEIRNELRSLGWSFHGDSDTEVLLKAWSQWGLDALPKFNGMFAFAAFNRVSGDFWLVRDRFGVKPLLWARLPEGGVAFSSSVAAIAMLTSAEIDIPYCARGLRYKVFETAESEVPFKDVQSVAAGGWLRVRFSGGVIEISDGHWYSLKQAVARKSASIEAATDEDLIEECRQLLKDSIRLRLRSDVPLAVSLSGGLDSSSIAALASDAVQDLKGFTYGSPEAWQSEGPVVAAFAQTAGIAAEYIWPRHDAHALDALLERTLVFQEAPFGGLGVLAQNEVFHAVQRAGFKVLLGGQGGDEAFAGYRKFFVVALRDALNMRDAGNVLRFAYSLGMMLFHEAGQAKLYWQQLSRYGNKKTHEFRFLNWEQPSVNLWGSSSCTLSDRQIDDIQQWSIPSLLRYEDRNSMGHGVETRLPFMDYRLVELALALPARLKIAKGYGKWALRRVTDGVVPNLIRLNRKKRGFDVTQSWIEDGIGASLRTRIHDHQSVLAPYVKKNLDWNRLLSNEALVADRGLLDEALMLAWLIEPVRSSGARGAPA